MLFHEPCCSMDLIPQLVVTGLQKKWTISWNLVDEKMNLDSLQEGVRPDTEMVSISNLPFAVC